MPSDAAILIPADAVVCETPPEAAWVKVSGDLDNGLAARLSASLSVPVVVWSMQTTVDMVWIVAYEHGEEVREVMATPERGWVDQGSPLPFEDSSALAGHRKKLRKQKGMLGPLEGYELLEAFLGGEYTDRLPAEVRLQIEALGQGSKAPADAALEEARVRDRSERVLEFVEDDDVAGVRSMLEHPGADSVVKLALPRASSVAMVQLLLENGADPNAREHDEFGEGPNALEVCSDCEGGAGMARLLLAAGAEVDGRAEDGTTPLFLAVAMENAELVGVLLDAGATVDVADAKGYTPLMAAVDADDPSIAQLLSARGADERDLAVGQMLSALEEDEFAAVQAGLGAVDAKRYGRVLLHAFVEAERVELVEAILERGADPNDAVPEYSPLAVALELEDDNIVAILRRHGAE